MMRLWLQSYAEPPSGVRSSALISTTVHVVVIALAVAATANAPQRLRQVLAERARFLPPPDRTVPQPGPSESIHYVALPATGGLGLDVTPSGADAAPAVTIARGGVGDKFVVVPVEPVVPGVDSVYSVLEVDSAVTRYANSAAPLYPPDLLAQNVEGAVLTEYVVDTTGRADPASLVILRSTHTEFSQAVREALPFMRFHPAKSGARRVRQLVEQQFSFRILPPTVDTTATARRPGVR